MDTSSATAQGHLLKVVEDEIKVPEWATQEMKHRWNALIPVSRLPPETIAEIFSLLPLPVDDSEYVPYLAWIRVTHVSRRWREIALHSPYLWNHINLTKLTLAGITEILARAKMSPLHFEAKFTPRKVPRFNAFGIQLEAHISHIRYLTISGQFHAVLERLVSPAPALVSLSLTQSPLPDLLSQRIIPDSLFNGTAPKLKCLELHGCSITWKSPLLRVKGLQSLEIWMPPAQAMPTLEDWLDALNEMSQLTTLHLTNATPAVSVDNPLISEPQRTVTLPSLTHIDVAASAKGCALALAHLVLPALISLRVTPQSQSWDGDDVRLLIPYVARNAHGPQDTAPLQTILLNEDKTLAEVVPWSIPDANVEVYNSDTLSKAAASARLVLSVRPDIGWYNRTETVIFDAMLSHLPLGAISTLAAQNYTRLSKEVWLSHAPRLTMLNQVLLVSTAVRAFGEMLEEDALPNGLPRFPQLTKLILFLFEVPLTKRMTYRLRDILVKRMEHGAPLEILDLRTCIGPQRAIQLLTETVESCKVGHSTFSDWEGRVSPFDEEEERTDDDEHDDGPGLWHNSTEEGGEEDGDEFSDDDDD